MISRVALDERVREWQLRHQVVEKDYVLGWLLWGIGRDDQLGKAWVFKGGTCLHKCYLETYRFSEDLDFTVLPDGPCVDRDVAPALSRVLGRVGDESGIDFSLQAPRLDTTGTYTAGRIYYRGPLAAPQLGSVRLDLMSSEQVVRPTVERVIAHTYPDDLPAPATVCCYSFAEVFAEKIRAMGERGRPRDLYDIVHLYRRRGDAVTPAELRAVLVDKCRTKGVPVPTLASIRAATTVSELNAEWSNMLGHQLPQLPPLAVFWDELPALFAWLDEEGQPAPLAPVPVSAQEAAEEELEPTTQRPWQPPPTAQVWGRSVPLEVVRFAAVNQLLVELRYGGTTRLIEPYALRRTHAGNLLLHAVKAQTGEARTYRVDRVQGLRATDQPFTPRYLIEFNARGPLSAPPMSLRSVSPRTVPSARPTRPPSPRIPYDPAGRHLVQCPFCQKRFKRATPDTRLNPHRNAGGGWCPGRYGTLLR